MITQARVLVRCGITAVLDTVPVGIVRLPARLGIVGGVGVERALVEIVLDAVVVGIPEANGQELPDVCVRTGDACPGGGGLRYRVAPLSSAAVSGLSLVVPV